MTPSLFGVSLIGIIRMFGPGDHSFSSECYSENASWWIFGCFSEYLIPVRASVLNMFCLQKYLHSFPLFIASSCAPTGRESSVALWVILRRWQRIRCIASVFRKHFWRWFFSHSVIVAAFYETVWKLYLAGALQACKRENYSWVLYMEARHSGRRKLNSNSLDKLSGRKLRRKISEGLDLVFDSTAW